MHKPSRVLIVTMILPLWGVVRLSLSLATSCRSSLPVRISSSGIPSTNSFGFALGLVEEPQSFKVFFAKHNLSSFKFSTKVWEKAMLVNTPILEAYPHGKGKVRNKKRRSALSLEYIPHMAIMID